MTFRMIPAELMNVQAFWYMGEVVVVEQNRIGDSYWHGMTWTLYLYYIVGWECKNNRGRTCRKLVIYGRIIGWATYYYHITWLIDRPWEGNMMYIIYIRIIIRSKTGTRCNSQVWLSQEMHGRRSTYYYIQVQVIPSIQLFWGDNILWIYNSK